MEALGRGQTIVFFGDIWGRPVDFVPGPAVFDVMRRPTGLAEEKKRLLWLRLDVDVCCCCVCCEPLNLNEELMVVLNYYSCNYGAFTGG